MACVIEVINYTIKAYLKNVGKNIKYNIIIKNTRRFSLIISSRGAAIDEV